MTAAESCPPSKAHVSIRMGRSGGTISGATGVLGVKSLDREGSIVAAHDQAPLA
jgi:hypothetical protein